jgi:hypothetical protein
MAKKVKKRKKFSPKHTLDAIAYEMSGKEWNADTLDEIARLLRIAGYDIKDTK